MKNFILMALVAIGFASCVNHDIEPVTYAEMQTQAYDVAFVNAYGLPSSTHNWGFGATSTGMRSIIKENHELPDGVTKPTLAEGEAEYVMNWFANNPGANSEEMNIDPFFIVYVGGKTQVNCWHHNWDGNYYNNNKNNGATSNFYEEYQSQNVNLDQLWINGEHMNDWNANGGVTLYVYNSKVSDIKAHNSYSETWTTEWKLAYIDVPGVGGGWYVGLTAYSKKLEEANKETLPGSGVFEDKAWYTDYDRAEYFENWVFKIVPGNGQTPEPPSTSKTVEEEGRVFCEDLGSIGDFDFNDVVFDAVVYTDGTADITLLAAGGELDVTVAGVNVHEHIPAMTTEGATPYKFTTENTNYKGIKDIPIVVTLRGEAIELTAIEGKSPQKICVPVGTKWAKERIGIDYAYPNFRSWVKDQNVDCWTNGVIDNIVR